MAKGFHQRPGLDYNETFSPVIKPVTIRTVLTIALMHGWPLYQLDISNAFLHGSLPKLVYMMQPPGFMDPTYPHHVCRLRKSLYGLRQAPCEWYLALPSAALSKFGFHQSKADDTSLFTYHAHQVTAYVLFYVDDLIITGSDSLLISRVISYLQSHFALKDLGALSYFLGIEVASCAEDLFLSQHKYTVDLLWHHHMADAKPLSTTIVFKPADASHVKVDPTEY